MATKKYLSLERLTEYDTLIKQKIDSDIAGVNTSISNITNGSTPVKEAEHATNADNATTSLDAEKLGGQLPSYYAKVSDIPTGALASKDIVSESDLDSALAEKVNAASEGNHSHLNKTVLDGITAEKVAAWDSAESNAQIYTDEQLTTKADKNHAHNDVYYTKTEIDTIEFITVEEIDAICGTSIQMAREVTF